jgi:hypothetical protein
MIDSKLPAGCAEAAPRPQTSGVAIATSTRGDPSLRLLPRFHLYLFCASDGTPIAFEFAPAKCSRARGRARGVKKACEWVANPGSTPRHARALLTAPPSPRLVNVALVFADLYNARHQADYDHLAVFTKATALQAAQEAEQAMDDLNTASARSREAFFALIALQVRKSSTFSGSTART